MKYSIMSHMIALYPNESTAMQVAIGLSKGGASFLEIQFPFSDPTADGPVIQAACTQAIEQGFTLDRGFSFISELTKTIDTPVYIMTYAAPVVYTGVTEYLSRVKAAGAAGCIIPDLPVGSDEGMYQIAEELSLDCVPVIAPNTSSARLQEILTVHPKHIYAALRAGITGTKTELTPNSLSFLEEVLSYDVKVLGGFGIRTREQVVALDEKGVASVIGSYFVERLNTLIKEDRDVLEGMKLSISELL